jgi:hypothetical protein
MARNIIHNPESLSLAQLGKGSKRLEIILIFGERMDLSCNSLKDTIS